MMSARSNQLETLLTGRAVPIGLSRLVQAVLPAGDERDAESCGRYQRCLPAFADAVLARDEKQQRWHAMRCHTLLCDECGDLFAELIDTLNEQLSNDPPCSTTHLPDLSFLEGAQ